MNNKWCIIVVGMIFCFSSQGWGQVKSLWIKDGGSAYLSTQLTKLGVGTTDPDDRLHIYGKLRIQNGSNSSDALQLYYDGDNAILNVLNDDAEIRFRVDGSTKLLVTPEGSIGIGTTDPGEYRLAVEGTIGAREIRVHTDNWADFVFADDYSLMPLQSLETFIREEKRLPGIPAESEIRANGIPVGEMQVKLLQKVEELTLYVLALQKSNEQLKERMNELGSQEH